jgi:hypothetical protein
MNTVAKGDSLETEVFQLLQRLIDDGDFYAQKELCVSGRSHATIHTSI